MELNSLILASYFNKPHSEILKEIRNTAVKPKEVSIRGSDGDEQTALLIVDGRGTDYWLRQVAMNPKPSLVTYVRDVNEEE